MVTFGGAQKKRAVPVTPTEAEEGLPVAGAVVAVGCGA
jgi:hypothetical protein